MTKIISIKKCMKLYDNQDGGDTPPRNHEV